MSLLKRDINPLNVLDMRRVSFIPPHFSCMTIDIPNYWSETHKKIDQWIYENLNSRYCLTTTQVLNSDRKIVIKYILGIEDPKELTLFTLNCLHMFKEE